MMNKTPKAPKCPATAESVECPAAFPQIVRFASFNVAMNRNNEGDLATELQGDPAAATQPAVIAETIQRVRPAVVLLNEFDYDADSAGLMAFMDNFLAVSQNGATPITYDYMYAAPSNTGIPSGVDLDNDGTTDGPNDAYGFGFFPGQYGMALLSMYPIDMHHVRTFQTFLYVYFSTHSRDAWSAYSFLYVSHTHHILSLILVYDTHQVEGHAVCLAPHE